MKRRSSLRANNTGISPCMLASGAMSDTAFREKELRTQSDAANLLRPRWPFTGRRLLHLCALLLQIRVGMLEVGGLALRRRHSYEALDTD